MESVWLVAALWIGLALVASLISMRVAISVALVEIVMGVIGGNFLNMHSVPWTDFLAGFGSILLTFLAGAEIEPTVLRKYLKESLSIGFISFLFPFLGAMAYAYYVAHWTRPAAQIAGIALSTTSVAVVYAVMVETGLNKTDLGKLILAACFVTDLGTVLALGVLFANYTIWLALFVAVMTVVLIITPRFTRWVFRAFGGHVSEVEIKLIFFLLFGLGGLAAKANSEAVLPAYLLGLVVASLFAENKTMVRHLRTTVFAFLTPFYFLKAGMLVSLPAVWTGAAMIIILLVVKMVTKVISVWPLTRLFQFRPRTGMYTTLLMSTGLTFGTISALFGYTRQIIDRSQYTVLVTVVIASAIIPTMIAQTFFRPKVEATSSRVPATELASVAEK
jgi:Kef-type K+ transport system membrane component KefB